MKKGNIALGRAELLKIEGADLTRSLVALFMVSLSLLLFQIVITRILSAILLYHYVFAVTSFAILGLGLGGMVVYKWPKLSLRLNENPGPFLANLSLLLALVYVIIMLLITLLPFLGGVVPYICLSFIPFITGGVFIAALFKMASPAAGKLYFADLLGAGLGSLAAVFLLDACGLIRTAWLICLLATLAALILSFRRRSKSFFFGASLAGLLIWLFFQGNLAGKLERNFRPFLTAPNKYVGSVNAERGDEAAKIIETRWDSFSRTDVVEVKGEPDRKDVTIDGVAFSGMYRFGGDLRQFQKGSDTSGYFPSIMALPFMIGRNERVALIGTGGGRDVLYALLAGSKKIAAVEINPSTVEAVRRFGKFNGYIYDRPEVQTYVMDGRTFIKKSPERYDLIFLSLVKTEAIGTIGFSLTENYIFTREALAEDFKHLNENGKIAFIVHHEAALAKLTATALTVLKERGIKETEIPLYLAVINSRNLENNQAKQNYEPLLIIKQKPFTEPEAKALLEAAAKSGNEPLFIPYLQEVARLGDIRRGKAAVADFQLNLPYNAQPATDDRPYFYHFEQGAPPVLWITLIGVIGLTLVLFRKAFKKGLAGTSGYFTCLGIGFMLLEIPLIQKFILYLGHPTLAFAWIVFALLIGGGIGSYFSGKEVWQIGKKKRHLAGLVVCGYGILILILAPRLFQGTFDLAIPVKGLISILLVLPLGFFMGMPFPFGIKMMDLSEIKSEIPLMWGLNGVMTVVGSVAAVLVSMLVGFDGTILVGAGVYLVVFLFGFTGSETN